MLIEQCKYLQDVSDIYDVTASKEGRRYGGNDESLSTPHVRVSRAYISVRNRVDHLSCSATLPRRVKSSDL